MCSAAPCTVSSSTGTCGMRPSRAHLLQRRDRLARGGESVAEPDARRSVVRRHLRVAAAARDRPPVAKSVERFFSPEAPMSTLPRAKVLVVDDSAFARKVLREV